MIVNANALTMPLAAKSVQMCVTSPPYFGLRDYQVSGQIGLEQTPEAYIANIVAVGREVWRVLADDGTFWINLGDAYTGRGKARGGGGQGPSSKKQLTNRGAYFETDKSKRIERGAGRWGGGDRAVDGLAGKNLMMIPARVALALQSAGWYLRAEIVWAKPNPMPESVTDRPTRSHEIIYLLSKRARYFYDAEAVKESAAVGWRDSSFTDERDQETKPGLGMKPRTNGNGNRKSFRGGGDYTSAGGYTIDNDRPRNGNETHGNTPNETGLRNQRDVWSIATQGYDGAHYATFPTEIPRRCILAGSRPGDVVLDPFCGSGTTGEVCRELERRFVGLDLSMKYLRENALPRSERKCTAESIAALPLFGGGGGGEAVNKQDELGKRTYTGFNARWKETHP